MVTTGGAFFFFDLEAGARGGIDEVTGGIGSADPTVEGRRVVTGGTVSDSTEAFESCGAGIGGPGIGGFGDCDARTEGLGGCADATTALGSDGGFVWALTMVLVGSEAAIDNAGSFVAGCARVAAIGFVVAGAVRTCVGAGAVDCVGVATVTLVTAEAADGIGTTTVGCAFDSEASVFAGSGSVGSTGAKTGSVLS
jgi:hypothetical protein